MSSEDGGPGSPDAKDLTQVDGPSNVGTCLSPTCLLAFTNLGAGQEEPPTSDFEKKKQTFITRTIWTLAMIGIFFGSMAAGHLYLVAVVTAVQIMAFKEVIAIANVPSRDRQLRFTKSLNWYFLATTMYFLYGESVIYYFKHILLVDAFLLPFATHHRFISFALYVIGWYPAIAVRGTDG